MDKYTVEMALFEIWGALQTAETVYDFSKVRTIAKKEMKRAGLLEEEKMGMADYIERKKVIDMLDNAQIISDSKGIYCGYCTEDVNIMSIPSSNVREDVQGEWEWIGPCRDAAGRMWATCSACKIRQRLGDYDSFCPNCGARMTK